MEELMLVNEEGELEIQLLVDPEEMKLEWGKKEGKWEWVFGCYSNKQEDGGEGRERESV